MIFFCLFFLHKHNLFFHKLVLLWHLCECENVLQFVSVFLLWIDSQGLIHNPTPTGRVYQVNKNLSPSALDADWCDKLWKYYISYHTVQSFVTHLCYKSEPCHNWSRLHSTTHLLSDFAPCRGLITNRHLHFSFYPSMQAAAVMKEQRDVQYKTCLAKLQECRGRISCRGSQRKPPAIPRRLTGQIMLRYQPQCRKRITCVQIELSVWKLEMQSFPWEG